MDEFKKNLRESTGFRFFLYLLALLVCTLLGAFATRLLAGGGDVNGLRWAQAIGSLMMFVAPPLILYAITRSRPFEELGFRKPFSYWLLLIGVLLMFVSLPVTNQLTAWNEKMSFGPALEALESLLKQMEEEAAALTERMLQVDSVWGLLANLVVIALIPALGEELTFRGVLQQALTKRCKSHHVAVILSAAIFSFIHFQFYGFLPRMFLGLILGYLFYYSGSLWTSILMHFVNNGTAVVIAYLDYHELIDVDVDHFGATSSIWILLTSLAVTLALLWISNKIRYKYGRK